MNQTVEPQNVTSITQRKRQQKPIHVQITTPVVDALDAQPIPIDIPSTPVAAVPVELRPVRKLMTEAPARATIWCPESLCQFAPGVTANRAPDGAPLKGCMCCASLCGKWESVEGQDIGRCGA